MCVCVCVCVIHVDGVLQRRVTTSLISRKKLKMPIFTG